MTKCEASSLLENENVSHKEMSEHVTRGSFIRCQLSVRHVAKLCRLYSSQHTGIGLMRML